MTWFLQLSSTVTFSLNKSLASTGSIYVNKIIFCQFVCLHRYLQNPLTYDHETLHDMFLRKKFKKFKAFIINFVKNQPLKIGLEEIEKL